MTREEQAQWIAQRAPLAQAAQQKCGVLASVTLAQAIIESSDRKGNWGQSQCAREANNDFGIKVDHQPEAYIEFPTKEFTKDGHPYMEPGARFRKFDSEAESFEAHSELIANARRYRPAMDIAQDAKITDAIVRSTAFAAQLQACGYSTNPKYAEDLTWLIRRYNLIQYDTPPPDSPAAKEKAA